MACRVKPGIDSEASACLSAPAMFAQLAMEVLALTTGRTGDRRHG
jgi:hypothetical protein